MRLWHLCEGINNWHIYIGFLQHDLSPPIMRYITCIDYFITSKILIFCILDSVLSYRNYVKCIRLAIDQYNKSVTSEEYLSLQYYSNLSR